MTARKAARQRRDAAQRVLSRVDNVARAEANAVPTDPELAAEIDAIHAITKLLEDVPAEAWAPIPAPDQTRAPAQPTKRRRRPLTLSRALAAASVIVSLGLGFAGGAIVESGGRSAPTAVTSQTPAVVLRPLAANATRSLAVAYMPEPGQIELRIAHLPTSPPGTYYELWLMSSLRHLTPVTAFRIAPSGRAELSLRLPDDPHKYLYLDISLQRIGAGTAHSGDSILRGRVT
jgi:hypothetical protein